MFSGIARSRMVLGNNDRGQSECQRDKLKEEMS